MKFILNLSKAWEKRIKRNEILAPYTYFRIGGPADYFVTVKSSKELKEVILSAEAAKVPWFILGGGSNILVGDFGFRGLVIKNDAESANVEGKELTAESGIKMSKLAAFSIKNGLAGLEVFMSVPGTLGGAVFNNSHFRPEKNEFIGNLVKEAEVLLMNGENRRLPSAARISSTGAEPESTPVRSVASRPACRQVLDWHREIVNRDWFRFGYDYSRLHDETGVVLNVRFRLKKSDPEKLKARSLELLKQRNSRQPIGQLSCGCMFKNPDGMSAGQLIDDAGMKGKRVGGAVVSDKHANFIVNTGGAKAEEVLKLMDWVKRAVKTKSGIDLEPEIFRVGEFSKGDPNDPNQHPNVPNREFELFGCH